MGKYSDDLLGTDTQAPSGPYKSWSQDLLGAKPQADAAAPRTQEPQKEGWADWAINSVRGRHDPAYAGTPSVFSQFTSELRDPTGYAALAGASDAQMHDVIKNKLGDRYIRTEKDANGYDVIVTRGADGNEQRGYVNQPGLDTEDAWRAFHGALPYVLTGGGAAALTRGAGVGLKALAQGAAAVGTSAAGDVAQIPMGSEQGIDIGKAGTVGAFGAAGPVVGKIAGALWNRFVTIPGLVDKSTGRLTAKGMEAARKAGVDPAELDADFSTRFAQAMAETGDESVATTRASTAGFDVPITYGQMSKDPALLTREEAMRRGLWGDTAGNTMRKFYDRQSDAISGAAIGHHTKANRSIAGMVQPSRNAGRNEFDRSPATLGESIGESLTTARDASRKEAEVVWEGARNLEATPEAFSILPNMLSRRVGDRIIDTQVTPAAARMAQEMDRFISGESPDAVAGVLRQAPVKSVDQMRRRLLGVYKSAATGEDAAASRALYDGFNDWIGEAAAVNLLKGDPAAAGKIAAARGFTREVSELFSPGFGKTPAAARLSKILDGKTDSGESVIKALFGASHGKSAASGTAGALRSVREILKRFGGDGADQAWNDVRLAYWNRIVLDKKGNVVGTPPTAGEPFGALSLANAIKTAMHGQKTVFEALFTAPERRKMAQFVRTLERVAFKPPNASGSGYTAGQMAKDFMMKLLDSFGLGTPARMAIGASHLDNLYGSAMAQRAVSGAVVPKRPNLGPVTAPVGQQYDRQSR